LVLQNVYLLNVIVYVLDSDYVPVIFHILDLVIWMDYVESDLRDMCVKRWRTRAFDRTEWASLVREAKAKLKGL
jgi:hypothetical protein